MFQVEQGIERKYLNPPLGEDEETKKQKQREAAAQALKEFNEMMKGVEERKKKSRKEKKGESRRQADEQGNNTENGEQKERDEDASSSSSEEPAKAKTCLERWAESLLACSSLSQVFVHMNTLDQSIAWSKSVLNARCRLCRRKGDAEHMLLCDACDRGHHMYCLKPPIKQVSNLLLVQVLAPTLPLALPKDLHQHHHHSHLCSTDSASTIVLNLVPAIP